MFAVLPDLDQALIEFLTAHPALAPLHGGRVSDMLQSPAAGVRIAALGGTQPWPWQGTTEYQIECWGGTTVQADTLARTVVAAIYDMRGPITGGYVTASVPTLRPLWSPDDNGRPRFIVQVAITVSPEGQQ